MSRAIFIIVMGFICGMGFSVVGHADVTGTFNFDISLSPEGTQTEAVNFLIDLQSNLQYNSTFSGITLGADLGFGVTGIEFSILKLAVNLGALTLRDDNVFAVPFGCRQFAFGVGNGPDINVDGQCPGREVVPIGDGDSDGMFDANVVGFVKKRTELEINIGGITLGNVLLFEDVDFPDIQGGNDHEHDHFNGTVFYDAYSVNNIIDDQTPTFGFGDIITISGQTVSGVTLISETAICASGKNYIKKRNWDFEVNKSCAVLEPGFVVEGGGTPFLLEEQRLWIKGIAAEGFVMDLHSVLRPASQSFEGVISTGFIISDLASVLVTTEASSQGFKQIEIELFSENVAITLTDEDADISIDTAVGIFSFVLNPNANQLDFGVRLEADKTGLTNMTWTLGFSQGLLDMDTTTEFRPQPGSSGLDWFSTAFHVSADAEFINFGAEFSFSTNGLSETLINVGILF